MDTNYQDHCELTGSGTDDGESHAPKENIDVGVCANPKDNRVQRNTLERKRKEKIKMYISQLKEMIPTDYLPSRNKPASSNTVLEQAVTYMKHLKDQAATFFNDNGSQAQRVEIERLKQELLIVTMERDKYEKMVQQAAAVTPTMGAELFRDKQYSEVTQTGQALLANVKPSDQLTTKLPGQGLIITQTGQAYYVNEQGIPVAQGMAPTQLLPEHMLAKSSHVLTSQSSTTTISASTDIPTSAPNVSSNGVVSAGSITNGLVALPGHTGQLPSAIILPNGQVIPVVTSSNTSNGNLNTSLSSVVGTTSLSDISTAVSTVYNNMVVSSQSSGADLSCTTSNSPGVVLAGGMQTMSAATLVTPTNISQSTDSTTNTFCKIMPKPTMYSHTPHTLMAPALTLAPIPLPTCSISIAPSAYSDHEPGKKKRISRKKKGKDDKTALGDILATAAANLFSPEKAKDSGLLSVEQAADNSNMATSQYSSVSLPAEAASSIIIPTHPVSNITMSADPLSNITMSADPLTNIAIPTNPLNGVRARRTRKRKNKEAKAAATSAGEINQKVGKKSKAQTEVVPSHNPGNISSDQYTADNTETEASQAIEFDSNDLDNILDQVENIEDSNYNQQSTSDLIVINSDHKTSDYQVVSGDEEIGPVFTTSNNTKSPGSNLHQDADDCETVENLPYTSSDSYLIGNLTKTTDQPVDHRLRTQKSEAAFTSVPGRNLYASNFTPYQPYDSAQQPSLSKPPEIESSTEMDLQSHSVEQSNQSLSDIKVAVRNTTDAEQCNASKELLEHEKLTESSVKAKPFAPVKQTLDINEYGSPANFENNAKIMHETELGSLRRSFSSVQASPSMECKSIHNISTKSPQRPTASSNLPSKNALLASPAWSPAKDAENVAKKFLESNPRYPQSSGQDYFEPPAIPSYYEYPITSSMSDVGDQKKSNHSSPHFQDTLYQYTQFSSAVNNSMGNPAIPELNQNKTSHVMTSNPPSSQNQSFQHQPNGNTYTSNQQPWQRFYNNDSNETVPYDHRRSSSEQDSHEVPQRNTQQHVNASQQHIEKRSLEKDSSKTKTVTKQQNSGNGQKVNKAPVFHQMESSSVHLPSSNDYRNIHDSTFGLPPAQITKNHGISRNSNNDALQSKHNNMFSTESLLNKSDTERTFSKDLTEPQHSRYHTPLPLVSHSNDRMLFDKDKSFMANHVNNLFNSSTPALGTLQTSIASSLAFSSFSDPTFTFSLTSTSASLPVPSKAPYHNKTSSSGQLPFLLHPTTQQHDLQNMGVLSSHLTSGGDSKSNGELLSQPSIHHNHTYSNTFDTTHKKSYQKKVDSANGSQQPTVSAKSKRAKSRQTEVPKEIPPLPYNFPTQPYGVPAFPTAKNNETAPNFFSPQPMYNKPAGSLGIPFQHPSFPALHQRPSHSFPTHPEQIHQPTGFNINNIFKENSSMEAFKLNGNSSQASMYPPQSSHLYHNPMSINNILGSAPGFDANRVAAFAGTHHNFPSFHPPFDFNVSSQQ